MRRGRKGKGKRPTELDTSLPLGILGNPVFGIGWWVRVWNMNNVGEQYQRVGNL